MKFFSKKSENQNRTPRRRSLRMEALENRELLSATPWNEVAAVGELTSAAILAQEQPSEAVDLSDLDSEPETPTWVVTTVEDTATEGSLRYAVANASKGDTITFAPELNGATITLGGTAISVKKSLTIDASALEDGLTISGAGASRIFTVSGTSTNAELIGLTLTDGYAPTGYGGALYSNGLSLSLTDVTVVGSKATYGGGVYINKGSLSISGSTITDNAGTYGGGVYSTSGTTVSISDTTIADNSAEYAGGGVYLKSASATPSALTITSSIIKANSAAKYGGAFAAVTGATVETVNSEITDNTSVTGSAIYVSGATLNLASSTVAGNSATFALNSVRSTVELHNTIFAANLGEDATVIGGNLSAYNSISGYNGWNASENVILYDGTAELFADAENGDYTLSARSIAVNAGDNDWALTELDLAGNPRVSLDVVDIGAYEFIGVSETPSLVVTTLDDVVNEYDGVISLREAIAYAAADSELGDTITFDAALDGGTIALAGSALSIKSSISIDATELESGITVDAGGASRVVTISGSKTEVELAGLTLTGGAATNGGAIYANGALLALDSVAIADSSATLGGGVYVARGELVVLDSELTGNSAVQYGGAIYTARATTAAVLGSNLSGNKSSYGGGAIYVKSDATGKSELSVVNSFLQNNSAPKYGGAIAAVTGATVRVTTSLVTGNSSAGGSALYAYGANAIVNSSTITANTSGPAIYATRSTGDFYNTILAGNKTKDVSLYNNSKLNGYGVLSGYAGWTVAENVVAYNASDALFTDAENGDYTLADDSVAINAGINEYVVSELDLVGAQRIAGLVVDLGAYEYQSVEEASTVVTTLDDVVNPFDGLISLREAVLYAEDGATVSFDSSLEAGTITLGGEEIAIDKSLAIEGFDGLVVSADGASRVFNISGEDVEVSLTNLTVQDGAAAGNGGAILIDSAKATLTNVVVANSSAIYGGGVYVDGGQFEAVDSAFTGNTANNGGGGVFLNGATANIDRVSIDANKVAKFSYASGFGGGGLRILGGNVTVENTLIVDNYSAFMGGGLTLSGTHESVFTNVTVAGNVADDSIGGLDLESGTATFYNSIVALNRADFGNDVYYGRGTLNAYNTLYGNNGWTNWEDADAGNVRYDSSLPLFAEGSYELADGSQAIDKGNVAYVASETDLAGNARIQGISVDFGAYEHDPVPETPSLTVTTLDDVVDEFDGQISLREAIAYALADDTLGDTIAFDDALAGGTIALGSMLEIRESLTIDASNLYDAETGVPGLTLDGQSKDYHIIDISAPLPDTLSATQQTLDEYVDVALIGLNLINGKAAGNKGTNASRKDSSAGNCGGAIYAIGANLTVENSVIKDNVANTSGGAVYSRYGSVALNNVELSGNNGSTGSALFLQMSSANVVASVFDANIGKNAGAIEVLQGSVEVRDSSFTNNTCANQNSDWLSGAAIALFSNMNVVPNMPASAVVDNCYFGNNSTSARSGGAISTNAACTLTVSNSTFEGNKAAAQGGAISVQGSELNVSKSVFIGNEAEKLGGAIYASTALINVKDPETGVGSQQYPTPVVTISDSLFAGNSAKTNGGAIYLKDSAEYALTNVTIADNSAGIFDLGGTGTIVNSIIVDSVETTGTANAYNTLSAYADWANAGSATNYVYDADKELFNDAANGDYTLTLASQARDRGDAARVVSDTDLAGEPRVSGRGVDLGAYEYQVAPETPALTVTTLDDVVDEFDGEISLREAIAYALADDTLGDKITFDDSLAGGTIALTGMLEIRESLMIDASNLYNAETGTPGLTLDGQSKNYHIFDIACAINGSLTGTTQSFDEADYITVSLKGLNMINGVAGNNKGSDTSRKDSSAGNYGGAIYALGTYLTVENSVIQNCKANSLGGGLYVRFATTTLNNVQFLNNSSTLGSAVANQMGRVEAYDCVFDSNVGNNAGAVEALQGSLKLVNSSFTNNTCSNQNSHWLSGGAVVLFSNMNVVPHMPASAEIDGCYFANNKTANLSGGAISTNACCTLAVSNSVFENNSSGMYGGAISCQGSELTVDHSIFRNNSAEKLGGAIYASTALINVKDPETNVGSQQYPTPSVTISDSLIVGNKAVTSGGAVYLKDNANYKFTNVTIADNNSGIYDVVGNGTIINSIVLDSVTTTGTLNGFNNLSYYTDWSNADSATNYELALMGPLFADREAGDYSLQPDSQAQDRGDSSLVASDTDLAGNKRIYGRSVDLGAYELVTEASASLLDEAFADLFDEIF